MAMMWTPATPFIWRTCWIISTAILIPSSATFSLGTPFRPVDQLIGHVHAGHGRLHIAGHADRFARRDARENVNLLVDAEVAHHLHPLLKLGNVEDTLGLDKLRARSRLFCQPHGSDLKRVRKGILGTADKEIGLAFYLFAAQELPVVPQSS